MCWFLWIQGQCFVQDYLHLCLYFVQVVVQGFVQDYMYLDSLNLIKLVFVQNETKR